MEQTREELIAKIEALEEELGLMWAGEVRCAGCNKKLDIELENREIITIEEVIPEAGDRNEQAMEDAGNVVEPEG